MKKLSLLLLAASVVGQASAAVTAQPTWFEKMFPAKVEVPAPTRVQKATTALKNSGKKLVAAPKDITKGAINAVKAHKVASAGAVLLAAATYAFYTNEGFNRLVRKAVRGGSFGLLDDVVAEEQA